MIQQSISLFAIALFFTFLAGLGVTAGKHRYFCHRSFKGTRALDILLMIMSNFLFQHSINFWVRDHRMNHKYIDTDADPYNSQRGLFFSHVGWYFVRKHYDIKVKGEKMDMSDLEANPVVMFDRKYCVLMFLLFGITIPTLIPWYFWNESLKLSFFCCTVHRNVLLLHVTWSIKSIAHAFGTKNYDKNIVPTDNTLLSICSIGEGFHNYHHIFPTDYKTAELGGSSFNLTKGFIDALAYEW